MKISDLEIYLSAAHYLSFTEVAHQLNMTQPGVSRTIKNIEQQVCAELFDRSAQTLALTQAGEVFLECSRMIIEQYQKTLCQLDDGKKQVEGSVRLKCMNFVMSLLADKFMPYFLEKYPKIKIEHQSLIYHEPTDHEYDGISLSIHKPHDQRMIAQRIFTYTNVFYASKSYLKKYGHPTHPGQIGEHRCLVSTPVIGKDLTANWFYLEGDRTVDISPKNVFSTNSLHIAATLCSKGAGIARLPTFLVNEYFSASDLIPVFGEHVGTQGHLYAIYRKQKVLPYRVQLLLKETIRFFADFESRSFNNHN